MAMKLTVIGAGPGGYVAAVRAVQMGAEVTVIEREKVGGVCLNWGCIPTKSLLACTELLDKFHRAKEFGLNVTSKVQPDIKKMMVRKEKVVGNLSNGIMSLFQQHKIKYIEGDAYISAPGKVSVQQSNGKKLEVDWDKLIIAVGSSPAEIPGFSFDGERILSSNHALSLPEVPNSIMIVGGGVIGCEFAFILNSLGSRVVLVEAMQRLIPLLSVDEDCSTILQREMKKKKIKFLVNRSVETFQESQGKLHVVLGPSPFTEKTPTEDKQQLTEDVDKILVCVGRKPVNENLGLKNLGINTEERGWIKVDERMQTNVEHVYAIGDILGPSKIMLAHVASAEGMIAAENALGEDKFMSYDCVPAAIFTSPEIANVGLTENQALKKGYNARAESMLFRSLGKAQAIEEIAGQAKIVFDQKSSKVLGIHLVGPHATELIAEGTLALKMGCKVQDIAATIHAHPTLSEIFPGVSWKALGLF